MSYLVEENMTANPSVRRLQSMVPSNRQQATGNRQQRGAIAVMVAILLAFLLAFSAFAIDLPYVLMVRNELQNAADAAALRGAACLYRNDDCDASPRTTDPNFNSARSQAGQAVSLNRADGQQLAVSDVATGYWNLSQAYPGVLNPPATPVGPDDVAAVQVTISKVSGVNGGEIGLFMARLLNIFTSPANATAVAIVGPPGTVGKLFPIAVNDCMFLEPLWNVTTNQPRNATSTSAPSVFDPPLDQIIGQPYIFGIASSYHGTGCRIAQWTSLNLDASDTSTMRKLMDGTADGVANQDVGDNVWIQPGTKNALYDDVHNCSAAGDRSCEWVFVPVVNDVTGAHAEQSITGFACLHILDGIKGANPYIKAQLGSAVINPECVLNTSSGGGGGPNFGLLGTPGLVK